MEEAQKEKTLFMLKDIINYCEDAREPNILQRKLPLKFVIKTTPRTIKYIWNEPLRNESCHLI